MMSFLLECTCILYTVYMNKQEGILCVELQDVFLTHPGVLVTT